LINLNNISVIYGDHFVLDNITLSIPQGDKVGVVGKNGCGKSTLLNIIAGNIIPDEGNLHLPSETSIGFLHQDIEIDLEPTVIQAAKKSLEELAKIEQELDRLKKQAEKTGQLTEDEGFKMTELEERFRLLGGYSQEAEAEKILKGLGFSRQDMEKKVGELSGGWRMRVELAKILLANPDILLLDEPNNHLDMESIIWLEKWLTNCDATVLTVSHDAEFIENASSAVLEMSNGKAHYFKGSFADYHTNKELRRENDLRTYQNQQKELAEKQRTIDRFRAKATKAKMAKSMEKQLNKMELVDVPEEDTATINFRFQPPPRSGDMVIKVNGLSKSYGPQSVLEDVDFEIRRGEKVSLVGKNGEGKSTFVKVLTGDTEKNSGEVVYGHNVSIGYFAQDQDKLLDGNLTLLQFMEQDCPPDLRPKLRGILGSFLFSNDDVEKKIKVLSGGERSRLAMAKMLLKPFNLLILDEPTNHLDIPSKEILKQTIDAFEGTVIIVSHDRHFLRGLSERTCEFTNRNMVNYLGDIDYFLEKKGKSDIRDFEKRTKEKANTTVEKVKKVKSPEQKKEEFELRKELNKTIRYCERNIDRLENEITRIEQSMSDPAFFERDDAVETSKKLDNLKSHLEEENEKWEVAVEKLTELEAE